MTNKNCTASVGQRAGMVKGKQEEAALACYSSWAPLQCMIIFFIYLRSFPAAASQLQQDVTCPALARCLLLLKAACNMTSTFFCRSLVLTGGNTIVQSTQQSGRGLVTEEKEL